MPRRRIALALAAALLTVGSPSALGQADDLSAVPRADCGPGSDPETAEQGRVPRSDHESGRADRPYTCNTELVGHHGSTGGFKVHRYVDVNGTECAYYDSTFLLPLDAHNQASTGFGVIVLDMTDPANPVSTATLTTPAMLSPHESLVIHPGRGLLMAALGTVLTHPGIVDIYDISQDCTNPRLLSTSPVGFLGHESGVSADGNTMWVASTATGFVAAVDITDPTNPQRLWLGDLPSHGITISEDGNRAYFTPLDVDAQGLFPTHGDLRNTGVTIFDVSEIQAREPDPQVTRLAGLSWPAASIAQIAIPVTIDGHPYLVEIDEFVSFADFDNAIRSVPGVSRIIDISDERSPFVVSNIRLEVHEPAIRESGELANDPGAQSPVQAYTGHYCSVPTREDPGIVACSMTNSGLRVFDIRDPHHPREIAYFNAPADPLSQVVNPEGASFAMSAPAFVPERSEIWYSDSASGFWAVRVTNDVWPFAEDEPQSDDAGDGEVAGDQPTPSTGPILPTGAALVILLVGAALACRGRCRPSSAWPGS